jgi:hypothetical protein
MATKMMVVNTRQAIYDLIDDHPNTLFFAIN